MLQISPGRRSSTVPGDVSTTDLQVAALELGLMRANNNSTLRPPTVDGMRVTDSYHSNGGRFPIAEAEETGDAGPDADRPTSGTGVHATTGSPTDETSSPEEGALRNGGKRIIIPPLIPSPTRNGPKSELPNANHLPTQRESSFQRHPPDKAASPVGGSLHMEAEVTPSKTTARTAEVSTADSAVLFIRAP